VTYTLSDIFTADVSLTTVCCFWAFWIRLLP